MTPSNYSQVSTTPKWSWSWDKLRNVAPAEYHNKEAWMRKNFVRPKGFSRGKIPYLNAHIQLLAGTKWLKAVVFGWQHAEQWLAVKEILAIDCRKEAFNSALIFDNSGFIPVLKDALQPGVLNLVNAFDPDVIYFNFHGGREQEIIRSVLNSRADVISITTNYTKRFFVENGFHLENVREGKGPVYVATLIKRRDP